MTPADIRASIIRVLQDSRHPLTVYQWEEIRKARWPALNPAYRPGS